MVHRFVFDRASDASSRIRKAVTPHSAPHVIDNDDLDPFVPGCSRKPSCSRNAVKIFEPPLVVGYAVRLAVNFRRMQQ